MVPFLITCKNCKAHMPFSHLEEYEGVYDYLYHCPHCFELLATSPHTPEQPEPEPEPEQHCCRRDFSLTPDELRYTLHCLGKQDAKLQHARKQLSTTIAKLEIMLETAKEECCDC